MFFPIFKYGVDMTDENLTAYERAQLKWGMSSVFTAKGGDHQETAETVRLVAIGVGVIRQPDPGEGHPGILEVVIREILEEPTDSYFHCLIDLSNPEDEFVRMTPSFPDVAPFIMDFIAESPIVFFDDDKERMLLEQGLIRCGFEAFDDEMIFGVDNWVKEHIENEQIDFEGFISSFMLDIETNRKVLTGTRQYVDLLCSIFMEVRRQESERGTDGAP